MSNSCLTTGEFLTQTGTEFVTFGANSTGDVEVAAVPGAPGGTIVIGGVTLISVAGARTSGSDDFSLASGTTTGIAQEIVDCISDAANSFTTLVTASIRTPGLSIVDLVSVSTGVYSELPLTTNDAVSFVLSAATLEGGAAQLDSIITTTCSMMGDCWGEKKSYGHLYRAAHFATVQSGGETGAVSSKSIDKISVSYATTAPSDPDYGTTKWGRLYLALYKTLPILPQTGRSDDAMIGLVGGGWWW